MRWFGRATDAPSAIDAETRAWFLEPVEVPTAFGEPSPGTQPRYEALRCQWCQGIHFRACPRVKQLDYHETGQIKRVQFWPEGSYDDSDVIWPEQVFTDEA